MKLISKHFTLAELIHTNTGLLNVPNKQQFDNLQKLVTNVLDPLRQMYNSPIIINSGFRSILVNKKVRGAINSDHCWGYAADIKCDNNALIYRLIRDNFTFRQLIWEKGNDSQPQWVHVSFNENDNKKQILRIK